MGTFSFLYKKNKRSPSITRFFSPLLLGTIVFSLSLSLSHVSSLSFRCYSARTSARRPSSGDMCHTNSHPGHQNSPANNPDHQRVVEVAVGGVWPQSNGVTLFWGSVEVSLRGAWPQPGLQIRIRDHF